MLLYSADSAPDAISKYFAYKFWNMPEISSISVSEIVSYCKQNDIGIIIPTRDGELAFFASIKKDLKHEHISVMIPGLDTVTICLDKLLFYQFCKPNNFPAIETAEHVSVIKECRYVVKERYGAGSKSIGFDLSKEDAVCHANILQNPVFQPFIKGKEYSIDAYMDNKANIKGIIVRERIKVVNGESKITQKVDYLQLENLAADLIKKLNIYGHSVMQIIVDENNMPHILECNNRFGGASTLSLACGLDSFYWFFLESMGEDISKYPFVKESKPLKMIRYETDLII